MKRCIIFYGFCRSVAETFDSLKRYVLDPYDLDVFIYCPYDQGTDFLRNNEEFGKRVRLFETNPNPNDFKQFIRENRLPRFVILGDPVKIEIRTYRFPSMMYNLSHSVELFNQYCESEGIRYDRVILTRPDLRYFARSPDLDRVMGEQSHDLYFSLTYGYDPDPDMRNRVRVGAVAYGAEYDSHANELKPRENSRGFFSDQFFVGSHQTVAQLAGLFSQIVPMYRDGVRFSNETMIANFCFRNQIRLCGFWANNFTICRVGRKSGEERRIDRMLRKRSIR